jgi:GntR family transcriptional repressor for pyruvate dehydrogenase complex
MDELVSGRYDVGDRLPAERELSAQFNVSRPTVREAVIALEVQGLVEVRVGSGAYVKRLPGKEDIPGFNISAFELTEARLLFEGEAAATAATTITEEGLAELAALVEEIERENRNPHGTEKADRAFHLAIAAPPATRRGRGGRALVEPARRFPGKRAAARKARSANIKPVVEEHTAVLEALRARPGRRPRAMRTHLASVLDSLLFATEEKAIARSTPRPGPQGSVL